MIWNESKECMDREDLNHIQSERLKKQTSFVYTNIESYRKKMQEVNLSPYDINGIEDLEKLPFTVKEDMREAYPFGLFAKPMSEVIRLHASSGTTGKPTIVGYTAKDIEVWKECVSRVLSMASLSNDDIIMVSYGYGLFTGGLGLHYGSENRGLTVIPTSTTSTKKQLDMMVDTQATAIACTPSYLMYLGENILEEGLEDKINLRVAICGGEPWTDEMRKDIEKKLNIEAFDIYGLSEIMGPGVGADCSYHQGLHIFEDYFLPEIIDPKTLKPVEDGQLGELVITTLSKEATPMIRYRTGDLTSITHDKCECGRTHARIDKLSGRIDDMLVIRGVNVFPSQIESVLIDLGYSTNYQIVIDRINNLDTFELWVEVDDKLFSDEIRELEKARKNINKALRDVIGLNVKIKLVEYKSLERSTGKSNKIIDNRKL